jgi:hypothetical protein
MASHSSGERTAAAGNATGFAKLHFLTKTQERYIPFFQFIDENLQKFRRCLIIYGQIFKEGKEEESVRKMENDRWTGQVVFSAHTIGQSVSQYRGKKLKPACICISWIRKANHQMTLKRRDKRHQE